ncbi:MAG: hypothetical protein KDB10_12600 [Acidimicrobiales bacterium]|nr:hypothetical protein [Acidimicrobiales bacterium]
MTVSPTRTSTVVTPRHPLRSPFQNASPAHEAVEIRPAHRHAVVDIRRQFPQR